MRLIGEYGQPSVLYFSTLGCVLYLNPGLGILDLVPLDDGDFVDARIDRW